MFSPQKYGMLRACLNYIRLAMNAIASILGWRISDKYLNKTPWIGKVFFAVRLELLCVKIDAGEEETNSPFPSFSLFLPFLRMNSIENC